MFAGPPRASKAGGSSAARIPPRPSSGGQPNLGQVARRRARGEALVAGGRERHNSSFPL